MRFPNATKGVKRIYLGEMLALIAALALGVTAILAPGAAAALSDGTEVGGIATVYILLITGASILGIVAFVLNILGIMNARKDDDNFKMALLCAVLGIVLSVVAAFFQNNTVVYNRLNSVVTIDQLFTSYFVLSGIMSLARQLNDSATERKAHTSRTWLIIAFLGSAVCGYAVATLAIKGSSALIAVGLVNIVVQLVTYIIYLRALGAGRSMLTSN